MKRIFFLFLFASISLFCSAQELPMSLYINDANSDFPDYSINVLQTKLEQAMTTGGITSSADFTSFSLVTTPVLTSKNVTAGLQPTVVLGVDLSVSVMNNFTGSKFAGTSITLKGAGKTEEKAMVSAIYSTTASGSSLQAFMVNAKKKVFTYYDRECENIISQARSYATTRNYLKALCLLGSVPTGCSRYSVYKDALLLIWQQYVDFEGNTNLQKARSAWIASQDRYGAEKAAQYLSEIYPDASCYPEAMKLSDTISARIGEEWEMRKKIYNDSVNLESQRIEAARAVGVAYGTNQKPTTYVDHWMVR